MGLDILDRDPHDPEPPLKKRLARRVLGDPRKAPSRLLYALIFLLIAVIVVGIWSVLQSESDPSSSSYWFIRALASVLNTMWILVPVAFYLYWRYVGVLRKRYATKAADVTGWLPETVEHLADEMRSTDGTTRVITTTDHSFEEIKSNVDAALRGESHDSEEVDYFGRYRAEDSEAVDQRPRQLTPADEELGPSESERPPGESSIDELSERETDLMAEYERLSEAVEERLDNALGGDLSVDDPEDLDETVSLYDLMDDTAQADVDDVDELLDELDRVEEELAEVREELDAALDAHLTVDETDVDDANPDTPDDVDESAGPSELADPDPVIDEDGYDDLMVYEGESDATETLPEVYRDASGLRGTLGAVASHLWRRGVDAALVALSMLAAALVRGYEAATTRVQSWLSVDTEEIDDEEWEIPWKVRFAEELKHLFLDLSASLHSDEVIWKFGLPATVTFIGLVLAARLWVNPLLYLVFIAVALLVGLFVFWLSKKRRSRRLRTHRQPDEWSYWDDAAGRVKTVETDDVTCYMGWLSGRRYATYNREEFVREFSLRLHHRTHDERVAPSVLEQYARNIAQMKPNLRGHLEHIERPMIQQEIKNTVEQSREQVIDKAGLAMDVIEHPHEDKRLTSDLGHDPRLVAQEYRWLVEEGHVLAEVNVEFEDASGETTTKTLVYPADKTRLPDMEALHSQFSDRFTGAHGDPYYHLPDCTPTEDLSGFVPSATVARMFRTEEGI